MRSRLVLKSMNLDDLERPLLILLRVPLTKPCLSVKDATAQI